MVFSQGMNKEVERPNEVDFWDGHSLNDDCLWEEVAFSFREDLHYLAFRSGELMHLIETFGDKDYIFKD